MKVLVFFYTNRSSFVRKDIEALKNNFVVKEFHFNAKAKWKTPFVFLHQLLFLFLNIAKADIYLSQFAAYHSFLPAIFARLFGKKAVIIAGGVDCVSLSKYKYGNFNKKVLGKFTEWSFRFSSLILPKHESLIEYEYHFYDEPNTKQGIKAFCRGITTPMKVIHNGYDSTKWFCNTPKHENSFLTVTSGLNNPVQMQLKGIDLILDIAFEFPDYHFTILGVDCEINRKVASNVKLIPPVKHEELQAYYSEHQFYFQLSLAEGFPNAICEAMLCECVPIASDVFSLPNIVGDTGYLLKKRDVEELKALIEFIKSSNFYVNPKLVRKRIVDLYSFDLRKEKILMNLK
jgi:glycosyltransferase involved in cell wall biosynthesis